MTRPGRAQAPAAAVARIPLYVSDGRALLMMRINGGHPAPVVFDTGTNGNLIYKSYADDIGMNADVNLFGPGNRANATIGRATRLILRNVFQMIPGISDKSTQGNPGKYSFCIAERARGNPWPLLCAAQGYPPGTSSVTVFAGGGFCNVENHGGNTPEQILGSVADAMANYGCITLGQSVVILAPEHMGIVGGAGWTRERAQDFLFTRGYNLFFCLSINNSKKINEFNFTRNKQANINSRRCYGNHAATL